MSTKLNVETFIAVLRKSGLVEHERLQRALGAYTVPGDENSSAAQLADHLIATNLLTKWQTEKLLQGKHRGYFLGKYKLLSLLGKGGMSSVYLAEHLLMRRRCALKVLPAKRVDDSSYLERFHREAQAVAALDHPNIVRAYDVDHQNDGDRQIHFLVMEHVEGASLQELVTEKGMASFLDAAEYARQAALGLQHAHENGMVHRDIKPGNLLVDLSGVVKILDLGLARFFMVDEGNDALTIRHDEKVLGTADYLAPEQALDSHTVDARADIYSLGCTLYFMVTGQPPFTEGTLAQRLLAHQVKTPPTVESLRPDTPPTLAAIIRKMMEKHPNDRYATAIDAENGLFHWIDENADIVWRKAHSGVYGSRVSDSGIDRVAIPVAKPVANPPRVGDLLLGTSTPPQAGISQPISSKSKLPRIVVPATETHDTSLKQFFSTLSLPTTEPTHAESSAKPLASAGARPSQVKPSNSLDSPTPLPPTVVSPSPHPSFEARDFVKAPATKPGTFAKPTSPDTSSRPGGEIVWGFSSVLQSLRLFFDKSLGRGFAAVAAVGLLVVYAVGGFGGRNATRESQLASLGSFPKDKHEVTVGGRTSEYRSIREALIAVRDRYRPASRGTDRMIVRVATGTYPERIQIDSRTKSWPEGITLLGDGDVRLAPSGDEPVVRLANISRFTIENIQIDAEDKSVAIELADDLHESHLSQLVLRGFSEVGILCKGAQGLSFGNSQLLLDRIRFEPGSARATGIRLEEGADNDANNVIIRSCRFLSPMAAGIVIHGRSPYGIEVTECLFNQTIDGLRVDGQPILKTIRVTNNSFRENKTGIRFSHLPSVLSAELAFRRNLFINPGLAEAIVQQGFDESLFRAMLSASPSGVENNWSDRPKPPQPIDGEITLFFEQGGRQGEQNFALASTDPKQAKFLAPTEKSPQRDVVGTQVSDRKWVGAVGP